MRTEHVPCPYCGSEGYDIWGTERGFNAVRCAGCGLLYVNPRPSQDSISAAVMTGAHEDLTVITKRQSGKVLRYRRVLRRLFHDVSPDSWLDVGAGYGEVMEAVSQVFPSCTVAGLEPMKPKADAARKRGLNVVEDYLRPGLHKVAAISSIDVFSHVPDFAAFLSDVRNSLVPNGLLFLETGNLADVIRRADFPGELYLPDHLVFAGERHISGFLERAGFIVERVEKSRIDGLLYCAKAFAKRALGRPARVRLPYTSSYRTMLVRARMH